MKFSRAIIFFLLLILPCYAQGRTIYNLENPEPCSEATPMKFGSWCFSCDRKDVLSVDKAQCDLCPNRTWTEDEQCDLLPPPETPLRDNNMDYHSCDEPADIDVAYGRDCLSCHNRTPLTFHSMAYHAVKCVRNCPPDKPLMDKSGKCHSCNEKEEIPVYPPSLFDYCGVCPNRYLTDKATCRYVQDLPERQEDVVLHGVFGDFDCNHPEPIYLKNSRMCGLCKNRVLKETDDQPYRGLSLCYLKCPEDSIFDAQNVCRSCQQTEKIILANSKNECPNRHIIKIEITKAISEYHSYLKCPADKPLMDEKGNCHACDEFETIFTNRAECNLCPERKYRWKISSTCSLCPPGRPVLDVGGNCVPLANLMGTQVGVEQSCGDNTNFKNYFGFCFPICPPDKPLPDSDGKCHSCDEEEAIKLYFNEEHVWGNTYISSQFCGLCPNRKIVLKGTWTGLHRLCVKKK